MMKPPISVTCAVILNESEQILVVRRSAHMSMPLKWEFPGGKLNESESEEECIKREIREELCIDIDVLVRLTETVHKYESITIKLIPFVCEILDGNIKLVEHDQLRWMDKEGLLELDWAAADIPIVHEVMGEDLNKRLRRTR